MACSVCYMALKMKGEVCRSFMMSVLGYLFFLISCQAGSIISLMPIHHLPRWLILSHLQIPVFVIFCMHRSWLLKVESFVVGNRKRTGNVCIYLLLGQPLYGYGREDLTFLNCTLLAFPHNLVLSAFRNIFLCRKHIFRRWHRSEADTALGIPISIFGSNLPKKNSIRSDPEIMMHQKQR